MSENLADEKSTSEEFLKPKEAPYGAEYAKSGRAACKGCKETISKGSLRMAVRFQSKFFDGFQDNWFHFECFWKKARKNDINEASIRGMDWLKWEDQELIRQRITELQSSNDVDTPKAAAIKVEHAKSGTGKCFSCKNKIEKGQLRISGRSSFYHVDCFHKADSEKPLFGKGAEDLIGYEDLDSEEKAGLDKIFPKPEPVSRKREHSETSATPSGTTSKETPVAKMAKQDDRLRKAALKKQSEVLWKLREELKENLQPDEMESLLIENRSYKSKKGGVERMLDKLVDMIAFGTTKPCPECNKSLTYSSDSHAYRCSGNITEYARCLFTARKPERTKFIIPKEMKTSNKYLKSMKTPLLPERVYPSAALEEKIGEASTTFKGLNYAASSSKAKSGASVGGQKMTVKHGHVVDPKCTVASTTHVFVDPENKRPWQANLSVVDVSAGKNSYYKMQIVKDDHGSNFYLFRAWGRVGTEIGGTKTEKFGAKLDECKEMFEELFLEKTSNNWEDYLQGRFRKRSTGMDILELDFSDKKEKKKLEKLDVRSSTSKLPIEVKELIAMVFDVNAMNDTMKEFEIDLTKMPLGRLSREHILKAYKVLHDLQTVLEKPESAASKRVFVDITNRFYTQIPHSTGLDNHRLLNNREILMQKTEMLDSLLEIEIAYKILQTDQNALNANGTKDIFDLHYSKLKCSMEVLDKGSEEFALIHRYFVDTHAPTHAIQLEIVNVLKIQREAEVDRFKKGIGNRFLLWHGSRLSNYAGILSEGLRIAPPEAPVTGYMFGKGIYTADIVTKSANYCYATGEGLLLLCDVALGDVQEELEAKDIKKPNRGKNSVKGLGGTVPDPKENVEFQGMTVPCGKLVNSKKKNLSLLYNEYIVYDESQVQLRYVVRVKFNNKLLL